MTSQMNLVHDAARLAMADHRAAMPRRARPRPQGIMTAAMLAMGALVSGLLSLVTRVSEPG
jgi:hypothetical protein